MSPILRWTLLALALASPALSQVGEFGNLDEMSSRDAPSPMADGETAPPMAPINCEEESAATTEPYDLDNPSNNALLDLILPPVVQVLHEDLRIGPGDATIVLRWTFNLISSWFEALAPYHSTAVGVYSDLGRRPASESETQGDQSIAVLYSSARMLTWWAHFSVLCSSACGVLQISRRFCSRALLMSRSCTFNGTCKCMHSCTDVRCHQTC